MSEKDQNLPAVRQAQQPAMLSVFSSMQDFESAQRMARALAASALVPETYRGESNLPNVLIAMEYAGKCGMSVLAVMQNLHVIQGRPSWSAPFLISSVNSTGKFTPLRYEREDRGKQKAEIITWDGPQGQRKQTVKTIELEDFAFRAWAKDRSTGEVLRGPWVSMKMAHEEGWTSRNGNKYRTMPEQMLMYRAASFFTRLYCPEVSMGMHTTEEVIEYADFEEVTPAGATVIEEKPAPKGAAKINQAVKATKPAPGTQTVIEVPATPPAAQNATAANDEPILPDQTANDPAVEQMYAEPDENEYETAM